MLTTVPGHPELTVTGKEDGKVTCTLSGDTVGTCGCGRPLRRDGHLTTTLTDVPWGRRPTRLTITAQRWCCLAKCPQPDPWAGVRAPAVAGKRPLMTVRLMDLLIDRYLRGTPATTLAAWCGITPTGLRLLLKDIVDDLLYRPRSTQHWAALTHIGIDEIFWRGRILCVIVDLTSGQLLELLPDREPETLREFLIDMNTYRTAPPVFVTDMWNPFRDVLRSVYGQDLVHVCDRFHIQAKISEDLRDAARLVLPPTSHRPRQLRQIIDQAMKADGSNAADLRVDGADTRQLAMLRSLTQLAVEATGIWNSDSVAEADHHLTEWIWQRSKVQRDFKTAGIEKARPFGRLEYLLQEWHAETLNYFDPKLALPGRRRPSSGRLEAANGKIRKLLLTSWHARRTPFSTNDEGEQDQFNRLWVRVMYRMNAESRRQLHLNAHVRPDVPPCRCGASAEDLVVTWRFQRTVWACPVGDQPVKAAAQQAEMTCGKCGFRDNLSVDTEHGMTRQLYDDVLEWRREGLGLRTLHRMTGVSIDRLRTATAAIPGETGTYPYGLQPPPLIGLQRWRWRGQHRWVITDPGAGTLIDILEGATEENFDEAVLQLQKWLRAAQRRGTVQVLLGDLTWADHLPDRMSALTDRFTVMNAAHRVLRDVLWQVTASLPVAARRSPELHRHRFVILANPARYRRQDDKRDQPTLLAKRTALLEQFPVLDVATGRIGALRLIFKLHKEPEIQQAVVQWLRETQWFVSRPETQGVGARSLKATLRNAERTLRDHQSAVIAGLHLQAKKNISLAASRRLIRSLNELPAAAQPDFEFLRFSARHVLGKRR